MRPQRRRKHQRCRGPSTSNTMASLCGILPSCLHLHWCCFHGWNENEHCLSWICNSIRCFGREICCHWSQNRMNTAWSQMLLDESHEWIYLPQCWVLVLRDKTEMILTMISNRNNKRNKELRFLRPTMHFESIRIQKNAIFISFTFNPQMYLFRKCQFTAIFHTVIISSVIYCYPLNTQKWCSIFFRDFHAKISSFWAKGFPQNLRKFSRDYSDPKQTSSVIPGTPQCHRLSPVKSQSLTRFVKPTVWKRKNSLLTSE